MILSYFKRNNKTKQDKEAVKHNISKVVNDFKENPISWDLQSMGDEGMAREKILNRLLFSINTSESKRELNLRRIYRLSKAAILLIGLSIGFLFKDEIMDQLITYPQLIATTEHAEREKLTLPDGSVVILNAGTKLSYPQQFKRKVREVTLLEGEAYFEVKHDTKKPFIVKADQTKTTVLGTAFNIRAYKFTPDVIVTVASGKVAVDNQSAKANGQQYFLLPNQQITYSKNSGLMQKNNAKAKEALGWIDGKLLFVNESFDQVISLLENKYDVKIDFEDKELASYHFSASFEPSESLYDVLDALTLTKGLQYEVKNKTIRIFNTAP